jgi:hypothetical protein
MCLSCKQTGHEAFECPLEPNLRTMVGNEEAWDKEELRVIQSLKSKEYNVNSNIVTYNMLEQLSIAKEANLYFRKNLLSFDDFTYSNVNENIFSL